MEKLQRAALISAAYVALRQTVTSAGMWALQPWGPRWLAVGIATALGKVATLMGVTWVDETYEKWQGPNRQFDPDRQYLICWHPHGVLLFAPLMYVTKLSAASTTHHAPGPRNWFVGSTDIVFRLPIIGEVLSLINARPITKGMPEKLMGNGCTFALQPGGIHEQVRTDHRRELLLFPPNLGFCRLAIQHGAPIVGGYLFGENQVFTTTEWTRTTMWKLHKSLGAPLPLVKPFPKKTTIYCKWGRAIEVGEKTEEPSEERVQKVFARYVLDVARIFEENRAECLPPEVAEKGLTVMWRGHSKEEFDALLESAAPGKEIPACVITVTGLEPRLPAKLQSKL